MAPITKRSYPDLKTWRAAHGLSTYKAADLLGMTQTMYWRLETGRKQATGVLAKRLMKSTGVSLEVLAGVA